MAATAGASKETELQIDEMRQFILNEAKDKAEEIASKALQEFDAEKQKVIAANQEKIRQEFEKKAKVAETQKAIARSTATNQSRLEKIKTRQDMLAKLTHESKSIITSRVNGDAKHGPFITKLIVQGLLKLLEEEVQVRCRACDEALVSKCLEAAASEYSAVVLKETGAKKTCKVVLDKSKPLAPAPVAGAPGASCLGGVVLACQEGTITIDNTLDSRLGLVMEQAKPMIRKLLFSS